MLGLLGQRAAARPAGSSSLAPWAVEQREVRISLRWRARGLDQICQRDAGSTLTQRAAVRPAGRSNLATRLAGRWKVRDMLIRVLSKSRPPGPSALRQALHRWVPIAAAAGEKHPLGTKRISMNASARFGIRQTRCPALRFLVLAAANFGFQDHG